MGGGVDNTREVTVELNAEVSGYQKAMEGASRSTETAIKAVGSLTKAVEGLVKTAGKVTLGFGVAQIATIGASVAAANRLDQALNQVRATSALTGQNVGQLANQIQGLNTTVPMSTNQLVQLAGVVQDLGIQGTANIVRFTEVAARLAEATNTAPGQLFAGLTQLTRAMGSSIGDLERYSSAVVGLSKVNGVAAGGIIGFSNAIQSVADRAGYSQTQVLGLATAFQKVGADGSSGANAFVKITNDITEAITTGSPRLASYANLVGMTQQQFASLAKDNPAEAFVKIVESIQAQGPRASQTLGQLGLDGTRTLRVFSALTSGQANLRGALAQSNTEFEKNTALQKSSEAAYEGLGRSAGAFKNQLTDIAAAFGGPFASALAKGFNIATSLIAPISGLVTVLNDLPGPVKAGISTLAGLAAGLTLAAGSFALLLIPMLKFLTAWRLINGPVGNTIFHALRDGLGNGKLARDTEGLTNNMQRLYRTIYTGADRMRGTGIGDVSDADNQPGFVRRMAKANFVSEPLDTLRHPLDPNKRNAAVNPMSMTGAFATMKNKVVDDDVNNRPMMAANEKLRNATMARMAAQEAAAKAMRNIDAEHLNVLVAQELSEQRRGVFRRRREVAPEDISADERERYINNAARRTGSDAMRQVRPRMSDRIRARLAAMDNDDGMLNFGGFGRNRDVDPDRVYNTGRRGPADPVDITDGTGRRLGRVGNQGATARDLFGSFLERDKENLKGSLSLIGRGIGAAGGALFSLATGPFALFIPLVAAAGVALNAFAQRGREAASKMSDVGDELAKSLGQTYGKEGGPSKVQGGADLPPMPYSEADLRQARSDEVGKANAEDLKRLSALNGKEAVAAFAQTLADRLVYGVNGGEELSEAQGNKIRQLLIRTQGVEGGRAAYESVNQQGTGLIEQSRNAAAILASANRDADRSRLPGALGGKENSGQAQTQYATVAGQFANGSGEQRLALLIAAEQNRGKGGRGFRAFTDNVEQRLNEDLPEGSKVDLSKYNMLAPDDYAKSIDMFLKQLREDSGEAGKTIANDIESAMKKAKFSADDYEGSLERLQTIMAENARQAEMGDPNSLASRIGGTTLGTQLGPNFDLQNTEFAGYRQETYKATQAVGAAAQAQAGETGIPAGMSTANVEAQITAWQQLANTIDDQSSPAYQNAMANIDALNGKLAQQRGFFMNAAKAAQAYAADALALDSNNPNQQAQIEANAAAAESNYFGSLQTLKSYVLQERDALRARERGTEDHQTSLNRMARDFNKSQGLAREDYQRSVTESNYQFSESLRNTMYGVAQSYGNIGSMVQSQMTAGAQSISVGIQRQNGMLSRSLKAMRALGDAGVSQDAIRLLGLDDPKNFQQAERAVRDLAQNPKMVEEWNKAVKDRLTISKAIAVDENNSKFSEMKRSFDRSAKQAADAFARSMARAQDSYQQGLNDFNDAFRRSAERQEEDLQRIAESTSMSIQEIMKKGTDSGIANIRRYAAEVMKAAGAAASAVSQFTSGGGAGSGSAGTTGSSGTGGRPGADNSRITADAGVNVAPGMGSGNSNYNPNQVSSGNTTSLISAIVGTGGLKDLVITPNGKNTGKHAKGSFHYKNQALDWGGGTPGEREKLASYLYDLNASGRIKMTELIHWGQSGRKYGLKNGQTLDYGQSTFEGHRRHVHVAMSQSDAAKTIKTFNDFAKQGGNTGTRQGGTQAFALGGIVNGATDATMGEQGPEAVIPLDRRGAQFMANLLREFMPKGSAGNVNFPDINLEAGDASEKSIYDVGKATIVKLDQIYKALGGAPVKPGTTTGTKPTAPTGVLNPGDIDPATGQPVLLNNPTLPSSMTNPILRPGDAPTPNSGLSDPVTPGYYENQGSGGTPLPQDQNPDLGLTPEQIAAKYGTYADGTYTGAPLAPSAPAPASVDPLQGARALSTFDAASRARLTQGYTVTGGDGRTFIYDPNSGLAIVKRARGGPVSPGQPYLVGENGPELFTPNAGGQIVRSEITRNMVKAMNTVPSQTPRSQRESQPMQTSYDSSTQISGPVTVQASDPREFAAKMQAMARMRALQRPVGSIS